MILKSVDCNVEEQETTITISRTDGRINLYTSDNTRLSKMQKLINTEGTQWRLDRVTYNKEGNPTGYFFSCDNKKVLNLRAKPITVSRTEEQKAAAVERMRNLQAERARRIEN